MLLHPEYADVATNAFHVHRFHQTHKCIPLCGTMPGAVHFEYNWIPFPISRWRFARVACRLPLPPHIPTKKNQCRMYKYLFIENRMAMITISAYALVSCRIPASGIPVFRCTGDSVSSIDCAYCCSFIFQCERDVVKMQTSWRYGERHMRFT